MRIAITGANGFVGAHTTRKLAQQHEVLAIDNLRYGPWRFSAAEQAHFKSDTTDLRDTARVEKLIKDFSPQAIIHLAAIHFIPECERLPGDAITINTLATVNLLSACAPDCRFVYTSTAAVYAPLDTAHREDAPIGPMDVYGYTKLHGEDFVRYFTRQRQLNSVIVRLFNVIGPGETNPHVLPEIVKQLKAGQRVLNLGNVHPRRDYIYVDDVANAFIATATEPLSGAENPLVVNLGTGRSYSVADIVARLSKVIGAEITISTDPSRIRKVDRPELLSDNAKLRRLFKWEPRVGIDEALRLIWDKPDFFEPRPNPAQ